MGFLDNFIKKEAKKFVSNKIDSGFDNLKNSFSHSDNNSSNSSNNSSKTRNRNDNDSINRKLDIIFSEEFSDYDIRTDVSAMEFNAQEGAHDYTYGVYLNGEPKAMIMILDGSNDYRKSCIIKAQNACNDNDIPYMNFMSYMSNHYDYVSNRLHSFIG